MAPRRLNIAAALQKLIKRQMLDAASLKSLETIAVSLERDGDVEGAGIVRAIINEPKPQWTTLQTAQADGMRWHAPTSFTETLVLDDTTRASIDELSRDLALTERFLARGIDAPTRALFIGDSGVGKTLAVRWLGWKLGLPVAIMQIDATVESHLGETAKSLRRNIDAALATPSILFIDEVEAICGKRVNEGSAAAREIGRSTSALLQQLDGLPPAQIVIAATNLPDHLDPALRRRLPFEIHFGLPTRQARLTMLQAWLGRVPIASSVLEQLADDTDGMSGATLRARAMKLGREAILADSTTTPAKESTDGNAVAASI